MVDLFRSFASRGGAACLYPEDQVTQGGRSCNCSSIPRKPTCLLQPLQSAGGNLSSLKSPGVHSITVHRRCGRSASDRPFQNRAPARSVAEKQLVLKVFAHAETTFCRGDFGRDPPAGCVTSARPDPGRYKCDDWLQCPSRSASTHRYIGSTDKGKPRENGGRKVNGLKGASPKTAGLPADASFDCQTRSKWWNEAMCFSETCRL